MMGDDSSNARVARWLLIAAAALSLVAGFALHRHAWIATAGSAAMFVLGIAWPRISVRSLRASIAAAPGRVRVGDYASISLSLSLTNRFPFPLFGVRLVFDGSVQTTVMPTIGPWRRRTTTLDVRPTRRGVIDLARCAAASSFPFGLTAATRRLGWTGEWIVWPARGAGPFPKLTHRIVASSRAALATAMSGGDELSGIRAYRAGDPMRHVHWKATARHERLIAREAHDAPRPVARIVLDLSDANDDDCERAIARAAGAAEHYAKGLLDVDLIVGDRTSAGPLDRLLDALARIDLSDERARRAPMASVVGRATLAIRAADGATTEAA